MNEQAVVLRHYDKTTIKHLDVISGISPYAMRRVFGGWILFAAIVGVIVSVAPDLSTEFIGITLLVLVAFTFVMFGQSRITEGWPSIVIDDGYIGVVNDPVKREFVCVKATLVTNAIPSIIKPNKQAVEIQIDKGSLSAVDIEQLKQAVWPREDKLIGLSHFKSREQICDDIMQYVKRIKVSNAR